MKTRQLQFCAFWRVLLTFRPRLHKFLPPQLASLFFLEHFWLTSVANKNFRMHTGLCNSFNGRFRVSIDRNKDLLEMN